MVVRIFSLILLVTAIFLGGCAGFGDFLDTRSEVLKAQELRVKGDFLGAIESANRALEHALKAHGPRDAMFGFVLHELGLAQLGAKQYEDAVMNLNAALEIKERTEGPDDTDTATVLEGLGVAYAGDNRFAEAMSAFDRSLLIWRNDLGDDSEIITKKLKAFATIFDKMEFSEGEEKYQSQIKN